MKQNKIAANYRFAAIDILRGLVMLLMALDHVRAFFQASTLSIDLEVSTAGFLTRWMTHFCAPTFVFLSGMSAYLSGRTRTKASLAKFLWTRGFWIVFLEVTVVNIGWQFNFDFDRVALAVMWALGASMVVLAGLVYLPMPWILGIGLALIVGHNAFDSVKPDDFGIAAPLWMLLHTAGSGLGKHPSFIVGYPLIPWVGVMAVGYVCGVTVGWPPAARRHFYLGVGAAVTGLFFLVRGINGYGDPTPWISYPSVVTTAMSWLNCTKYPPSLAYLLMTLGPSLMLLGIFDRPRVAKFWDYVIVYGRVPMFYYLVHLFWIHGLAVGLAKIQTGRIDWALQSVFAFKGQPGYGFNLAAIYLAWLVVVITLYPLCKWYGDYKLRHRGNVWLSYL